MREFTYNKSNPCPTDKHALEIYKRFLQFKKVLADDWRKGVVNGLLGHREYIDLVDCRLTMKKSSSGVVPVISLRPIVGHENEEKLKCYYAFFSTYENLRSLLLQRVAILVAQRETQEKDKRIPDSQVIVMTNLIKLLIVSMLAGIFDSKYEDFFSDAEKLASFLKEVREDCGHVVGPNFIQNGILEMDPDSDLIGSFYRYVRKLEHEFLKKFEAIQDKTGSVSVTTHENSSEQHVTDDC